MFIEYNINGKQIFNAGAGSERVVAGQAPGRVSGQAAAERWEVPPDRPTPCTLHPTPYTLHPNPTPSALNSPPCTLSPKP